MAKDDYYAEGLAESFGEHGITATPEQIKAVAADIAVYVENEGQAFYSPGWGERLSDIEDVWKKKHAALQSELEKYRGNAEAAVKRALRQYDDTSVSIGSRGEVLRHNGRTEQIQ